MAYQPPKLRCFDTKAANDAINAYRDAFDDAWRDILQVTIDPTKQQEFGLAALLKKAIDRGEKLNDSEIHDFWNLDPIDDSIEEIEKIY